MLFIRVPSGVLSDFLTRTNKSVSIENSPELTWPVAEVRGPVREKGAGRKFAGGNRCRPASSPSHHSSGEVLGAIDALRKRGMRSGSESTHSTLRGAFRSGIAAQRPRRWAGMLGRSRRLWTRIPAIGLRIRTPYALTPRLASRAGARLRHGQASRWRDRAKSLMRP